MNKTSGTAFIGFFEGVLFLLITASSLYLLTTERAELAIGPILLVSFLIIVGKHPRFAYYAMVFLIPYGSYRALGGSGGSKFLNIPWILGLWLIVVIAFDLVRTKEPMNRIKTNLWPLFGLFFAVALVSAFLSSQPARSYDNVRLLLVAYTFVAIGIYFLSTPKDYSKTILWVIIASISINSLLSILGYVFSLSIFAFDVEGFKRSVGGTPDPNNASLMTIFSLPLISYVFFSTTKPGMKILAVAAFIANILGNVFTFSRGGGIVLMITLFLIFMRYGTRLTPRLVGITVAVAGLGLVIVLALIPSSYWERQKSTLEGTSADKSIARRSVYQTVALDAFKESPIWGHGPGTFSLVYAASKYAPTLQLDVEKEAGTLERDAHNTYLEVVVGTGLVGLLLYLAIIWRALRNLRTARKNFHDRGDEDMANLTQTYFLSFVSLLLYMLMFSDVYHKFLLLSFVISSVGLRISEQADISHDDDSYAVEG